MEVRAVAKYIRMSPQKARLAVNLVRGTNVEDAITILKLTDKASARAVSKVLQSALANAENTGNMDVDSLYVKKAFVDQGPTLKRMRPRAQGRANVIRKRSSHITIVLDER
ncbi:MAG: 50S ribosomal protein L22 [Deltaproteobacteria bacterium]|nr:50S ribosomal protein L22 [Deltaproteobacteria bacterium]